MVVEGDGAREFHQTDHRNAEEIAAEPELSVLFALARILGPRRMDPDAEIHYICFDRPPELLAHAIASAGAVLRIYPGKDPVPYTGTPRDPMAVLDEAFAAFARRSAEATRMPIGEELLAFVEETGYLAMNEGIDETQERSRWYFVMEIGAIVGEIIRQRVGGAWTESPPGLDGTVPFCFAYGDARINVLGRAERFLARGESQSARWLLASLADRDQDRGQAPLFPVLKPADWGTENMVTRPLVAGEGMPLVALARDLPHSVSYLLEAPGDVDAMHAEALRNLAAVEVKVTEVPLGETKILEVTGSWYASEKLLDETFLRGLTARLGDPGLVAAAPYKGLLLVGAIDASLPLLTLAPKLFAEPKDAPISPRVFVVMDGRVVGHASAETAPTKKPGFWKRLFGKN